MSNTVECWNPNVRISDSAEIQTKWSPIPRRSDFGRSVCLIVRFEILSTLMYRTKQKSFGLDHSFGFQTFWCSNHYCYQTKVLCPKFELVRISAFHCIQKVLPNKRFFYLQDWGWIWVAQNCGQQGLLRPSFMHTVLYPVLLIPLFYGGLTSKFLLLACWHWLCKCVRG